MTLWIGAGLVASMSLFSYATIRDAQQLSIEQVLEENRIWEQLRLRIGDYARIQLQGGMYKKGYIRRVESQQVVLDTSKPKWISGLWLVAYSNTRRITEETILLRNVADVDSILRRDEMTYYVFNR